MITDTLGKLSIESIIFKNINKNKVFLDIIYLK